MRRVVVDASFLAAVIFHEPGADALGDQLRSAAVFAPTILQFEMANIAWKKILRQPAAGVAMLTQLRSVMDPASGIQWTDVNVTDVVLVAQATGLTPYDASYVWLAGSLGADLLTLDKQLAAIAADI